MEPEDETLGETYERHAFERDLFGHEAISYADTLLRTYGEPEQWPAADRDFFKRQFGPRSIVELAKQQKNEFDNHPDLKTTKSMDEWDEMQARHAKEKAQQMENSLNDWAELNRSGNVTAEQAQAFSVDKKREIDNLMKQHMDDAMQQPGFKEHVEWQRGEETHEQTMQHEVEELTGGQKKALDEDRQELEKMEQEYERKQQMMLENGQDMTLNR